MPTSAHWEVTNSPQISAETVHSAGPMWASAPTANGGTIFGGLMKQVLLSADGEISVYCVPDAVADDLETYCLEAARKPRCCKVSGETGFCGRGMLYRKELYRVSEPLYLHRSVFARHNTSQCILQRGTAGEIPRPAVFQFLTLEKLLRMPRHTEERFLLSGFHQGTHSG